MADFETFTYKGKDYKFRIGRNKPVVKPLVSRGSDYYKGRQNDLAWVMWLSFVPLITLAIIYFAYVGSDNPGGALTWFPLLAFPYGMLLYVIFQKIQDALGVLSDLQEHAEDKEYLDAYKAWSSRS